MRDELDGRVLEDLDQRPADKTAWSALQQSVRGAVRFHDTKTVVDRQDALDERLEKLESVLGAGDLRRLSLGGPLAQRRGGRQRVTSRPRSDHVGDPAKRPTFAHRHDGDQAEAQHRSDRDQPCLHGGSIAQQRQSRRKR